METFGVFAAGACLTPALTIFYTARLSQLERPVFLMVMGFWVFVVSSSAALCAMAYGRLLNEEPWPLASHLETAASLRMQAVAFFCFVLLFRHNIGDLLPFVPHLTMAAYFSFFLLPSPWAWPALVGFWVWLLRSLRDDSITRTVGGTCALVVAASRIWAPPGFLLFSLAGGFFLEGFVIWCFVFTEHGKMLVGKRPVGGLLL